MITIVDEKTGFPVKGGHDHEGKRTFQYYNDYGCNQIETKELTAKQLKRLMENPKNSEFYIEYQGEFKRIHTVEFQEDTDYKKIRINAVITL